MRFADLPVRQPVDRIDVERIRLAVPFPAHAVQRPGQPSRARAGREFRVEDAEALLDERGIEYREDGSVDNPRSMVRASDVICARPRSFVGPTASGSRYDSLIRTFRNRSTGTSYALADVSITRISGIDWLSTRWVRRRS